MLHCISYISDGLVSLHFVGEVEWMVAGEVVRLFVGE